MDIRKYITKKNVIIVAVAGTAIIGGIVALIVRHHKKKEIDEFLSEEEDFDLDYFGDLLKEYIPANPERVAYAIARSFRWTIAPCGDVALNKLGLSTQVPVVWSYISDGPYRKFSWENITLSFKHRANREISFMSETTTLVIEALKTLGKDRVDDGIILSLRNRLPEVEKKKMLILLCQRCTL